MSFAHAPLLLITVQVHTELARVAVVLQLLHVGVELLLGDDLEVEEHVRVELSAQLGTLAGVSALEGGSHLEGVGEPGDHVLLVEEVDDPERRSEEHTSELQSRGHLVCRLLLEKKKNT